MPLLPRSLPLLPLLLWPTLALAQLTPEKVAQIRVEEQAAMEKIAKEHGNRLPGEMSNDERRAVIDKQQAASAEVLARHGVSTKEWTIYTSRMSRGEQAQVQTAQRRLEDEAKAKAREKEKEKARAGKKDEDVVIQQGFGEDNPVELEATEDAPPEIERGTPAD